MRSFSNREKYIVQGILFKVRWQILLNVLDGKITYLCQFAQDVYLKESQTWLYGCTEPSEERAIKGAGHELVEKHSQLVDVDLTEWHLFRKDLKSCLKSDIQTFTCH
jgi:hypothetical protein